MPDQKKNPTVPDQIRDDVAARWLESELRALWSAHHRSRRAGMRAGILVAVEGIDAAGKATQARRLADALSQRLSRVSSVVEVPRYDSDSGRAIRSHLRQEWEAKRPFSVAPAGWADTTLADERLAATDMLAFQALMTYNRYEMAGEIDDQIEAGAVVVLDRWWGSSYAYGTVEGVAGESVVRASARLPQPDAWVLLDLPAEVACARRQARDRNEGDPAKLERVREAYLRLASLAEWIVVDAARPVDDVAAEVLSRVLRELAW